MPDHPSKLGAPAALADASELPSTIGLYPDEVSFPLHYRLLPSSAITPELARASGACEPVKGRAWAVSFQPCLVEEEASQDRWVVNEWKVGGRTWEFAAVFDGHAGPELAEHASVHLPSMILSSLNAHLDTTPSHTPESISTLLESTIKSYDDSIVADVLALFPSEAELAKMSDQEIDRIVNDHGSGGENYAKVIRCMRGTTAVIALVDWERGDMWVANLGDSLAVLASQDVEEKTWTPTLLTIPHNGSTPSEVARVRAEHAGEDETSIMKERVLGAITVTRALGDHEFKLPATYTSRVFLAARPGFKVHSKVTAFTARNKTPPYISARADVVHRRITSRREKFVLLCSDGLSDFYRGREEQEMLDAWAGSLQSASERENDANLALEVLRTTIGGEDSKLCSIHMTLDLRERWIDDTTVVVLRLGQ